MRKPRTREQFEKDLFNQVGNDYSVLEAPDEVPVKAHVRVRHNYCNYEWCPKAGDLLNKHTRCPKCSRHSFTPLSYRKYVTKLTRGKIEVLGDYAGFDTPLEYKCLKHNYTFYRCPISFRRSNYRCKKCKYEHISKVQQKSNDEFLAELHAKHKNIICNDLYDGTHNKLEFTCLICKESFSTEPNAILRLSGCPFCRLYHGEEEIKKFLDDYGIGYQYAKKFKDCKDKRSLHFDFYLSDKKMLIEYDGLQHYKSIEFFGGKDQFKKQLKHDSIKNSYAASHGYLLYRIPYQDKLSNIYDIMYNIIYNNDIEYLVKS